jgi:hypothetical protein
MFVDANRDGKDDITGDALVDANGDGIEDRTGVQISNEPITPGVINPRTDPRNVLTGTTGSVGQEEPEDVYYEVQRIGAGENLIRVPVSQQEAINRFFNRTPAQIKAIQEQFVRAGYKNIKATGRLDNPEQVDAYTKAVTDAWDSYSSLIQRNPNAAPANIGLFIDNAANQAGGGKPTTSVYETLYVTNEADAVRYFNQLYLEYTGTAPTPKQAKEFAKRLNAMEKQNVQRQVTTSGDGFSRTTVTRGGVDEVDKEQIALDLIGRVVTPEGLGEVSGQLGQNLKNIDQTLAAYNVKVDPTTRREYLLNSVRSKNGLNDVVSKIQNLSALQNPALAPYIQQGYKPQEVLGGYKQFKNSLTGLPDTPGLWDDPDMGWISKQQQLPDFNSFRTYVLDRPEADYYPEQRRQAASYALNILDMWGLR